MSAKETKTEERLSPELTLRLTALTPEDFAAAIATAPKRAEGIEPSGYVPEEIRSLCVLGWQLAQEFKEAEANERSADERADAMSAELDRAQNPADYGSMLEILKQSELHLAMLRACVLAERDLNCVKAEINRLWAEYFEDAFSIGDCTIHNDWSFTDEDPETAAEERLKEFLDEVFRIMGIDPPDLSGEHPKIRTVYVPVPVLNPEYFAKLAADNPFAKAVKEYWDEWKAQAGSMK